MLRNTIQNDISQTPLGAIFEGTSALETQPLPAEAVKKISRRQKRRNRHREDTYSLMTDSDHEEKSNRNVIPILIKNDEEIPDEQQQTDLINENSAEAPADSVYSSANTPPEIQYSEIGDTPLYDVLENKNTRVLSDSGIIYEIAEELYMREKTASEVEALFDPPFFKSFDSDELTELDRQAEENARLLAEKRKAEFSDRNCALKKPISTSAAFVLQAVMLIPVLNIVAAIFFSFRKKANNNIKAYCRAYMIWMSIIMTLALVFFAWNYFSSQPDSTDITALLNILK